MAQSMKQGVFQLHPFALLIVEMVIVKMETVAAVRLGAVHRRIGMLDQGLWRVAIFRVDRDTDTGRDSELLHANAKYRYQSGLQACDQLFYPTAGLYVMQHDDKLVTADTRQGALIAHRQSQAFGETAQQHVALVVPQRVIDMLEPIQDR